MSFTGAHGHRISKAALGQATRELIINLILIFSLNSSFDKRYWISEAQGAMSRGVVLRKCVTLKIYGPFSKSLTPERAEYESRENFRIEVSGLVRHLGSVENHFEYVF